MTDQDGQSFGRWLSAQLKARRLSQRQLGARSGVDHSTIARLVHGERAPSLSTATRLARALREASDEADVPRLLARPSTGAVDPVAAVERALRSDEMLSEAQVRRLMYQYLSERNGIAPRKDRAGGAPAAEPPRNGHVASTTILRPADLEG